MQVAAQAVGVPLRKRSGDAVEERRAFGGENADQLPRQCEVAASSDTQLTEARVLDRNGSAVDLPVTLGERTDPSGQRWLTLDLTLAALGAGDYIVELSGVVAGASHKVLTAVRVSR